MEAVGKIRSALGIRAEAVAVKYTDEQASVEPSRGRYAVCSAILQAAAGKVIMLSGGTCACPGGKAHIGLTEARTIPLKMLVEGEKLWSDVKTATRSRIETQKIAIPPVGIASRVYLYPASRDIFAPDLVIFLVNAEQVSRLVTLAQFWDGKTPAFQMRASMCWGAITYPLVSGNFNVTAGDISARRMAGWDENTMIASMPAEKIEGVADAVARSTAGTAESSDHFKALTDTMRAGEEA
jgi:uncharacterized protein (DUF169 family)